MSAATCGTVLPGFRGLPAALPGYVECHQSSTAIASTSTRKSGWASRATCTSVEDWRCAVYGAATVAAAAR
jgi:hypothetical protein